MALAARGKAVSSGSVYFLQAVDGGPIKIGFTRGKVAKRLKAIQACSPVELVLIGARKDVGLHVEMALHHRLAADRLHGEWFSPSSVVLDTMAKFLNGEVSRSVALSWFSREWSAA